jgi:hydroxysqualene synthase
VGVGHYENFPVASLLSPPALRPAIVAIYQFARTADDIADEGDASADERAAELARYRITLDRALAHRFDSAAPDAAAAWPQVFGPLAKQIAAQRLPGPLLHALLDAFEQDAHNPDHADRTSLLAYCARSANPVGRLLLHLYRIDDPRALCESDAVCTALQLINFWQDLSRDGPRGRCYVPASDRTRHGVSLEELLASEDSPRARRLVAELCGWARDTMLEGAPLVHRIPGRAGWELRLVVQGGLRVLERIERMDHATLSRRPRLGAIDVPVILWRALAMRPVRP